jgi:hypothetical protein
LYILYIAILDVDLFIGVVAGNEVVGVPSLTTQGHVNVTLAGFTGPKSPGKSAAPAPQTAG